jgi:hypothetical protein
MASDQAERDYMAFLDKANEDPSKGYSSSAAAAGNKAGMKKEEGFRAREEGVQVPEVLVRVCERGAFYVSDADEPFEAVALAWDEGGKGLPDEGLCFFFSPPFSLRGASLMVGGGDWWLERGANLVILQRSLLG